VPSSGATRVSPSFAVPLTVGQKALPRIDSPCILLTSAKELLFGAEAVPRARSYCRSWTGRSAGLAASRTACTRGPP